VHGVKGKQHADLIELYEASVKHFHFHLLVIPLKQKNQIKIKLTKRIIAKRKMEGKNQLDLDRQEHIL